MQVVNAHATFVSSDVIDESLTTLVARSVLEAALVDEEPAELWFELASDGSEDVSRLSVDLSYADIEELLRLSPEDEIALSLDGDAIESLFGDPDVEAHGMKAAIAIAVTSAALLAPAAQGGLPQATQQSTSQSAPQATVQATAQVSQVAATTQIRLQNKVQVSKAQVAKVKGFKLLRSGLVR